MQALIDKLKKEKSLDKGDMTLFMTDLVKGNLKEIEIINFLVELREKGESVEDIKEAAQVMRQNAVSLATRATPLLDTCGTGGDGLKTLNVSTLSALVAAAAGVQVAKHGNRSVSSSSGSADLLEGFGLRVDLTPKQVAHCLEKTGFGFMFAPVFHPAMKCAGPARQKIHGRTIFNCLGPLTNPAGATHHLLGVYSRKLVEPVCRALSDLGGKHIIVVYGEEGLDEISISGPTFVAEARDGKIETCTIQPEDFGLKRVNLDELRCDTKQMAHAMARHVLSGKPGPCLDFTLLNSAYALKAADRVKEVSEGIRLSQKLIQSGLVSAKILEIAECTQKK